MQKRCFVHLDVLGTVDIDVRLETLLYHLCIVFGLLQLFQHAYKCARSFTAHAEFGLLDDMNKDILV